MNLRNKFIIKIFICIILSFYFHGVFAQVFPADQAPPSVKWSQINTDKFQLIFPQELTDAAKEVATTLTYYMEKVQHDLHVQPKKISIILNNQGVSSNGFVQLAPRKSEFLTMPPVQTDPQKWLDQLAIHEYRHVVQFDKMSGGLRVPLELLGMAFFGVTLPPWLYEGDAVLSETLLTKAGRGRLPSWEMPLRANLLNERNFSYQKNFLGSYKSITPGYYELGYFLLTKLRRDHGNHVLDSILSSIRKRPFRPYNLSQNWKEITGYPTEQWHDQTMKDLKIKWKKQQAQIHTESHPIFKVKTIDKTDQFYLPHAIDSTGVYVLYQSRHSVKRLLHIKDKTTRTLPLKIGRQLYPYFNLQQDKITWDEIRTDPRFHNRTYNVINIYDIATQRQHQITRKSRYFSPSFDSSSHQIAVIEVDRSNATSLVILDASTGEVLQKIPSPGNRQLQRPSFDPSGSKVVCSYVDGNGAGILEFDLDQQNARVLLADQQQQVETPVYADDKIVFKAHYNGIDNLYTLDRFTDEITQISFARYGAFEPHYNLSDRSVWFNVYTADGFRISHLNLSSSFRKPIADIEDTFIAYFKPLQDTISIRIGIDTIAQKNYTTEAYNELTNLFNIHSLSLTDDFSDINQLKPQLTLLSDNLLNTLSARAGIGYNTALNAPEYTASVDYKKFLPILHLRHQNKAVRMGTKIYSTDTALTTLQWREGKSSIGIDIPLRFNRYNQNYQFGFSTTTSYTARYALNRPDLRERFIPTVAFPIRYRMYFGRNQLQAQWDLAPKWGQNFNFVYESYPFDDNVGGELFAFTSTFYFPGFMRNHSLQARLNYQHTSGNFRFSNTISMVSGFDQLRATLPRNTVLLDYVFPFAYPDWEIGTLAYIKRLRGGFFSDFEDFGRANAYAPRTLGLAIHADMNLLRFYLPIFDLGFKAIYVNEPNPKKWIFQFGFSYSY